MTTFFVFKYNIINAIKNPCTIDDKISDLCVNKILFSLKDFLPFFTKPNGGKFNISPGVNMNANAVNTYDKYIDS